MTTDAVFTRSIRNDKISREIVLRARGHSHGRVTRLVKHPYNLVTGHHSAHTNADSSRIGEKNISDIGRRPDHQGVLGRARR